MKMNYKMKRESCSQINGSSPQQWCKKDQNLGRALLEGKALQFI